MDGYSEMQFYIQASESPRFPLKDSPKEEIDMGIDIGVAM